MVTSATQTLSHKEYIDSYFVQPYDYVHHSEGEYLVRFQQNPDILLIEDLKNPPRVLAKFKNPLQWEIDGNLMVSTHYLTPPKFHNRALPPMTEKMILLDMTNPSSPNQLELKIPYRLQMLYRDAYRLASCLSAVTPNPQI